MSQPVKMSSLFKLEYPQSVGVFNTYDEAQHVVDTWPMPGSRREPLHRRYRPSLDRTCSRSTQLGTVIGQGCRAVSRPAS